MQESLVFLILRVGRLREDQLVYVETRENVFFYDIGPLTIPSLFVETFCIRNTVDIVQYNIVRIILMVAALSLCMTFSCRPKDE